MPETNDHEIQCHCLASGAYLFTWPATANTAGDMLAVDVTRASQAWVAVADVLAWPTATLVEPSIHFSNTTAVLLITYAGAGRWVIRDRRHCVVHRPLRPSATSWPHLAATVYRWLLSGRPLDTMPPQLIEFIIGPAPLSGSA